MTKLQRHEIEIDGSKLNCTLKKIKHFHLLIAISSGVKMTIVNWKMQLEHCMCCVIKIITQRLLLLTFYLLCLIILFTKSLSI